LAYFFTSTVSFPSEKNVKRPSSLSGFSKSLVEIGPGRSSEYPPPPFPASGRGPPCFQRDRCRSALSFQRDLPFQKRRLFPLCALARVRRFPSFHRHGPHTCTLSVNYAFSEKAYSSKAPSFHFSARLFFFGERRFGMSGSKQTWHQTKKEPFLLRDLRDRLSIAAQARGFFPFLRWPRFLGGIERVLRVRAATKLTFSMKTVLSVVRCSGQSSPLRCRAGGFLLAKNFFCPRDRPEHAVDHRVFLLVISISSSFSR